MLECSRCGIFNDNDALACKRCGKVLTPVNDNSNDIFNIIPIKYKRNESININKPIKTPEKLKNNQDEKIIITHNPMTDGKIITEVEVANHQLKVKSLSIKLIVILIILATLVIGGIIGVNVLRYLLNSDRALVDEEVDTNFINLDQTILDNKRIRLYMNMSEVKVKDDKITLVVHGNNIIRDIKTKEFTVDKRDIKVKQKYNKESNTLEIIFEHTNIKDIHNIEISFEIKDDYAEFATDKAYIDSFNSSTPLITPCTSIQRKE